MKFTRGERLFVYALIATIFAGGALLYADFNRKLEAGDNPVIGVLKIKHNKAQRKYEREVVWEEMKNEVPVRNADSIRTGNLSNAEIVLNNGTRIDVSENSMIVLNISVDAAGIDFMYGSINAKNEDPSGSKLNINTASGTLNMEQGEVKVDAGKDKAVSIAINSGAAVLQAGSVTKKIAQNESALVSAGKVNVRENPVTLLTPSNGTRLFPEANSVAQVFSWKTKSTTSVLEISRSSSFRNLHIIRTVNAKRSREMLTPGVYYWRVKALGKTRKEDAYSPVYTFGVYSNKPIVPLLPANNAVISSASLPAAVTFSFTKNELASAYLLEIANNRNFTGAMKDTLMANTFSKKLAAGKYYWRVTPRLPNAADAKPTAVRSFTVETRKKIRPLVLYSPLRNTEVSLEVVQKNGLSFSWSADRDIVNYSLIVASDKQLKNVVFKKNTSTNMAVLKAQLSIGQYYWSVSGVSKTGKKIKMATPFSFAVKDVPALELLEPGENQKLPKGSPITFRWRTSQVLPNLRIQLAQNAAFTKNLKENPVRGNFYTIKYLEEGTYFWKVSTQNDNSKIVRSFTVTNEIIPIVLLYPTEKEVIDMSNKSAIAFRWKGMDTEKFDLSILKVDGNNKNMIFKREITGAQYYFQNLRLLSVGNFEWKVSPKENSKRAVIGRFSLKLSIKPKKPKLDLPDTLYLE